MIAPGSDLGLPLLLRSNAVEVVEIRRFDGSFVTSHPEIVGVGFTLGFGHVNVAPGADVAVVAAIWLAARQSVPRPFVDVPQA